MSSPITFNHFVQNSHLGLYKTQTTSLMIKPFNICVLLRNDTYLNSCQTYYTVISAGQGIIIVPHYSPSLPPSGWGFIVTFVLSFFRLGNGSILLLSYHGISNKLHLRIDSLGVVGNEAVSSKQIARLRLRWGFYICI
jgi:hypothetical protein